MTRSNELAALVAKAERFNKRIEAVGCAIAHAELCAEEAKGYLEGRVQVDEERFLRDHRTRAQWFLADRFGPSPPETRSDINAWPAERMLELWTLVMYADSIETVAWFVGWERQSHL